MSSWDWLGDNRGLGWGSGLLSLWLSLDLWNLRGLLLSLLSLLALDGSTELSEWGLWLLGLIIRTDNLVFLGTKAEWHARLALVGRRNWGLCLSSWSLWGLGGGGGCWGVCKRLGRLDSWDDWSRLSNWLSGSRLVLGRDNWGILLLFVEGKTTED